MENESVRMLLAANYWNPQFKLTCLIWMSIAHTRNPGGGQFQVWLLGHSIISWGPLYFYYRGLFILLMYHLYVSPSQVTRGLSHFCQDTFQQNKWLYHVISEGSFPQTSQKSSFPMSVSNQMWGTCPFKPITGKAMGSHACDVKHIVLWRRL